MSAQGGCGGSGCQCSGTPAAAVAAVNGIALHAPGEQLPHEELMERAWGELLRQHAIRQGRLPAHPGLERPLLGETERAAIEAMLEDEVPVPQATDEEARRYYDGHRSRFVEGARLRLRHILFAVTPGVDVEALAARAEQVLHELKPDGGRLFAQRARELSNCPSGADGGELGWVGPGDLAPELSRELFGEAGVRATGVRPRLVHSRYGLHVIEVLERDPGREQPFEQVRDGVRMLLSQQSRARALHQYMRLLAGRALVEGVELEAADSPLVQ